MTTAQKVIKYIAIALAFTIIISIMLIILNVGSNIIEFLGLTQESSNTENSLLWQQQNNIITNLEIDLKCTSLEIKNSDKFYIETNNSNIKYKEYNEKIEIEEIKSNCISRKEKELTIYIPTSLQLDIIKLEAGAGNINITNLYSKKIDFDLGSGNTTIGNIEASNVEIDAGVGKLTITNGNINNFNFDLGVGETNITARIMGYNKLDTGVGRLNLNLIGYKDDYKIKVSKGIGEIKVDNVSINNDKNIGTGTNYIDIDGGVGSINISYVENIG